MGFGPYGSADPVCTLWVYERSKDGNTWRHGPQEGKISVTPIKGFACGLAESKVNPCLNY